MTFTLTKTICPIRQAPKGFGVHHAANGFSLPEITMAVGIAAMAIVLLLGLLPSGLTSIRDASNVLAESRIHQQILGEIQASNWGVAPGGGGPPPNLAVYEGERRFFDDQGTPLSNNPNENLVGYVARISLNPAGVSPAVPGGPPSINLVAVKVDIAAVPDMSFDFSGSVPFSSKTMVVAKQY